MKSKKFFKILFRTLGIILGLLIILSLFIFRPLDHEPYKGKPYYESMLNTLDSMPVVKSDTGKLKVGWAKFSIIPSKPVPIASYGIRKKYKGIHDSIWCRTFVFDNGNTIAAFVTLDLLIFPPTVVQKLKSKISSLGIDEKNIFLSATHTHNGPGGWAEGPGGRFLAGPFNDQYVEQLTNTVVQTVNEAKANVADASIGFEKFEAKKTIFNRFSEKDRDIDYWLRVMKIKKDNGEIAVLATYAGHPNNISSKIDEISGDYPGALVRSLEASGKINFAAFAAGAVATHSCKVDNNKVNFQFVNYVSSYLSQKIINGIDSISLNKTVPVSSIHMPILLRDPQIKVGKHLTLRPYVFYHLLGKQEVYISLLKIGDIVFVGTPCDFAGGLVNNFNTIAQEKNMNVVVTSFNGGYVGYILPDEYYDLDMREPRDMDWYGPNSGSYFTEVIQKLLLKIN